MLKKLVIAIGVLLAIFSLLLAVALTNLSAIANANKEYFLGIAETQIGRKLSVGSLGVSLAGDVSIRARDLVLADDAAFSAEPFARIGELRLTVHFWPLLWKELRLKRVTVVAPVITVIRDSASKYNFDSLGRRTAELSVSDGKSAQEQNAPAGEAVKPRRRVLPPLFAVGRITDGTVRYLDRQRHIELTVRRVDFALKPADAAGRVALQLDMALFAEQQNAKLTGRVGPFVSGAPLSALPFESRLTLAPLDATAVKDHFPTLLAALPQELQWRGVLDLKEAAVIGTAKDFTARIELDASQSEIRWRDNLFKAAGVPSGLSLDARIEEDRVELRRSEIRLRDVKLAVGGLIPIRSVGTIEINFESNQFAADGWESLFPALEPYRFSGRVGGNGKVVAIRKSGALRDLDLLIDCALCGATARQWDKSVYFAMAALRIAASRGERTARAASGPLPAWLPAHPTYSLTAAEILLSPVRSLAERRKDGDRLVDVKSEGAAEVVGGKLVLRSQMTVRAGRISRVDFKDLSTSIALADANAQVRGLKVAVFGGTLQSDGEYRFGLDPPSFNLSSQMQGIDIGQFARAVLGAEPKRMRGRLQMDLTLAGKGRSWEQVQPTLVGRGMASVTQGALLEFNLAEQVLRKMTGIAGLSLAVPEKVRGRYPRIFTARDTVFDELTGALALSHRVALLKEVKLTAPDFRATGDGHIDFDGRLAFAGALSLSQKLTRDLTHAVAELGVLSDPSGRLAIPFSAAGVMPRVDARPDIQALGKSLGGAIVRKGLQQLQEKLPIPKRDRAESPERKDLPAEAEKLLRKGLDWLLRR